MLPVTMTVASGWQNWLAAESGMGWEGRGGGVREEGGEHHGPRPVFTARLAPAAAAVAAAAAAAAAEKSRVVSRADRDPAVIGGSGVVGYREPRSHAAPCLCQVISRPGDGNCYQIQRWC